MTKIQATLIPIIGIFFIGVNMDFLRLYFRFMTNKKRALLIYWLVAHCGSTGYFLEVYFPITPCP